MVINAKIKGQICEMRGRVIWIYLLPTIPFSIAPFLALFQVSMILRDRNEEFISLARKALVKDLKRFKEALGTYGRYL